MLPTLYTHQESMRDALRQSVSRHRAAILQAEPGTGKTRIAKWILGASAHREPLPNQSGKSLFAVHRRGLVDNASDSFLEEPAANHGVIMSGRETAYGRRIQVGSIDTLTSWFYENGKYAADMTFDLIVFDECHSNHSKLAKFLKGHDAHREELGLHPAYVIGLSATPEARGLADVYHEIVRGPSAEWLIDEGYLSPFRYFRATQGALDKLVKSGGEFTTDSVCAAMEGLAGDLVEDWKRLAQGRATVGFFLRLAHAQEAMGLLRAEGVDAHYVDGDTPDDERKSLFTSLDNGYIDYICNVGVIERGTDIPRISCVQLCLAIGSIKRYRQMIGRGSRIHPDAADCIVLDHGGNVQRHGLFEDAVDWLLDRTEKPAGEVGTRPVIECPACQAIYRGGKCKSCGYEPTKRERKSQGLDFDGSELVEFNPKTRSKSEPKKKTCEQIMVESLYRAGRSNRTWKQALGIAYRAAEKQGTRFRVPKTVTVGGRTYSMLPYGSPDQGRRVAALYEFTR